MPAMLSRELPDEAARQAALRILPFLLSNPPFIPASSTSKALNRRHQILESSPDDVEEYLVTDTYPTDYPTAARSVELLRSISSLVEEQGSLVVGQIRFKCPEKDEIVVGVELGDKEQSDAPLLIMLLKLEGDDKDSESYKYDNILPRGVVPGPWFGTMENAVSFRKTTTETTETIPRAFPKDGVSSKKNSRTPFDGLHSHNDSHLVNDLLPAEEGGEGESSGEYIIDAAEFWDGFESEGDELLETAFHERPMESGESRPKRMQEVDDQYWEMYDQTGAPSNGKERASDGDNQEQLDMMRMRNEPVKLMLKEVWRFMLESNSGLEGSIGVDQSAFLQLAREAVHEVQSELSG